jgi:hypothetical protein
MDTLTIGICGAVAFQVLQTIQIAIVGRRVDTVAKSMRPAPLFCVECRRPHLAQDLDAEFVCKACRTNPRARLPR